jgi:Uma2 family endonuclease
MGKALQSDYRTNIEAFRAFIDDRPDHEKWELIDGEIILNPAPTNRHQLIVGNLLGELYALRRATDAKWEPMPGIGVRQPDDQHNEPEPDVMLVPRLREVASWTYDALAVFEVLSPFSMRRDMVHKLAFYRTVVSLTHYIVLAQDRREATIFARSAEFKPKRVSAGSIEIAPLGISLSIADLYRGVPLD